MRGLGVAAARSGPSLVYQINSLSINGQCTITLLLYGGPLLCGLRVVIKGLKAGKGRKVYYFHEDPDSLILL